MALFCGICCAGTGNILYLQHIISSSGCMISSSKDGNYCVQQRQVLVFIHFLSFFSASQLPMTLHLKTELFSVSSKSEVSLAEGFVYSFVNWKFSQAGLPSLSGVFLADGETAEPVKGQNFLHVVR